VGETPSSPVGSWTVTAVLRDRALVAALDGTSPSIEFDADGRVFGSAGCNRFTAGYESDHHRELRINAAASTRMFCTEPPGVMEQEAAFLDALARAAQFRREAESLQLLDASGAVLVACTQPAA
jgi:heat shock protein HslJ